MQQNAEAVDNQTDDRFLSVYWIHPRDPSVCIQL